MTYVFRQNVNESTINCWLKCNLTLTNVRLSGCNMPSTEMVKRGCEFTGAGENTKSQFPYVCSFSANGNGPKWAFGCAQSDRCVCVQRAGLASGSVSERIPYIRHQGSSCLKHPSIRSSVCSLSVLLSLVLGLLHHAGSSSAPDLAGSLDGSANSARR